MTAFSWAIVIALHGWLHFTNPYATRNVVQQPYTTSLKNGRIVVRKHFTLKAYRGTFAHLLGYYKSGFLIVQNAWFGSYKASSTTAEDIIRDIHRLRFNPTKPYLISGDQFSVLYPRNLGVFYNTLLNPYTAHDETDWQNRQRVYLQSVLYALDAFGSASTLTTTIVPISPRSIVLTQVHPGSVPSDTLYGMLYALDALSNESAYPDAPYIIQTAETAKQVLNERRSDLRGLLHHYLNTVRDETTGLVKQHVHLASARDGSLRSSSFYDNVILWKTLELAAKLGIEKVSEHELKNLRVKIITTFWLPEQGHFIDDLAHKPGKQNYSSDWLIALPTGFLSLNNKTDVAYLKNTVNFIKKNKIDQPLPLRYAATSTRVDAPWAVKTFVPNYGGDAIWSYWGAEYITLLAHLYSRTGDEAYLSDATKYAAVYKKKIELARGFPETFDTKGNFLQTPFYKSIRQTGWVVQFEHAEWLLNKIAKQKASNKN